MPPLCRFIFLCDIIQGTPPAYRGRAARLVGAKCALLARVDAYGQDPSGSAGETMKDDMRKKVEKWQEPALAKQTKARRNPTIRVTIGNVEFFVLEAQLASGFIQWN